MSYTYDYPMPALTVDLVVFSPDNHVLVIKRGGEPFRSCYAMPGGFMEINETLRAAAVRELLEETNLTVREQDLKFLDMFDKPDRDERGRVISACFMIKLKDYKCPKAGDDAAAVEWILPERLCGMHMAFDHKEMLLTALTQIGYYD